MVERSARQTCNPVVLCSSALWPLAGFVRCHPKFKFSARLVNSQLVASCQLGYLILSCFICIINFVSELFDWSACKLAG